MKKWVRIGAVLLGAKKTLALDIDSDALFLAKQNAKLILQDEEEEEEEENDHDIHLEKSTTATTTTTESGQVTISEDNAIEFIEMDLSLRQNLEPYTKSVDTVIMNPPFGTKTHPHIDTLFLHHAIQVILILSSHV